MSKACADLFAGLECTIIGIGGRRGVRHRVPQRPGAARGTRSSASWAFRWTGTPSRRTPSTAGAKVLVVERKVYLADATDVTEVVVSDTRKAMAHAAANFYDHPSQAFSLVGVTGTNGKTTTTYLVEHIARACGKRTGVIGTVGTRIGDAQEKTAHTTPESPDLQQLFARMRDARCDVVAMEVCSATRSTFCARGTPRSRSRRSPTSRRTTWTTTTPSTRTSRPRRCCSRATIRPAASSASTTSGAASFCAAAPRTSDSVVTTGFDPGGPDPPRATWTYAPTHTDVVLEVRGERVAPSPTRWWAASTWRTSCAPSASRCS